LEIEAIILEHFLIYIPSIFYFLLVSYTCTKWVLNAWPQPPPILMEEESATWARAHWL